MINLDEKNMRCSFLLFRFEIDAILNNCQRNRAFSLAGFVLDCATSLQFRMKLGTFYDTY